MPQQNVQTTLQAICQSIEDKLIGEGLYQASSVYISVHADPAMFPADDNLCVIMPGRQTVEQPMVIGGGSTLFSFSGDIGIGLFTRLALDQFPRDESYFKDQNLGLLAKISAVLKSLQLFFPKDENGDFLLEEPMKLQHIDTVNRFGNVGWGSVWLHFGILYLM